MALQYDPISRRMVGDNGRGFDLPVAPALDSARNSIAESLGGQVPNPNLFSDKLGKAAESAAAKVQQTMAAGRNATLTALAPAQKVVLSALGATPAAQPSLLTPEPTSAPPVETAQQTAAQTPDMYSAELLAGWQGPERPQQAAPLVQGARLTPLGSTMEPQQRGLYTMQNTDRAALAQRAAPTNGINFGAGGSESSEQYLARMAAQDRADESRNLALRAERSRMRDRRAAQSRMEDAVASRDPIAIRAARAELTAFDAGNQSLMPGLLAADSGLTEQELRNRGALDVAGQNLLGTQITAGATMTAAQANQAAEMQKVALKGQIDAQIEALKLQAKAATPEGAVAALRAQQIEAALNNGDLETATALLGGGRPAAQSYGFFTDPVTGLPVGNYNRQTGAYNLLNPPGEK